MKASEGDTLGSGEFALRNIDGGGWARRLGLSGRHERYNCRRNGCVCGSWAWCQVRSGDGAEESAI